MKRCKMLVVNSSVIIGQRILLISKQLVSKAEIVHLCWERDDETNSNTTGLRIRSKNVFFYLISILRHILKSNYDVILFCDFRFLPIIAIAGKVKGIKVIYDRQEFPTISAAEVINKKTKINYQLALGLMSVIERIFCKFVDGMLSIPLESSDLKVISNYNSNFAVVQNVPDLRVQPEPYDIDALNNKDYLIYSGTIAERTGFRKYLRIIKKLHDAFNKDIFLLVVGDLQLEAKRLEDIYREEGIGNNVILHKWIPYENLLSLIGNAKIGLALYNPDFEKYKHLQIGVSRKIFTYMLCGIPVVANNPLGEIITKENCGLVLDYHNEESLCSEILSLLNDDKRRLLLGNNGKNAIMSKYNWEFESRKIEQVFGEALSPYELDCTI